MFYTVNHTTHFLHTIRPDSKLEKKIQAVYKGERLVVKIGHDRHSVFTSIKGAKDFVLLLELQGD
jgi:hypothetical protein